MNGNNWGIHGKIFKLRISGFQALAAQEVPFSSFVSGDTVCDLYAFEIFRVESASRPVNETTYVISDAVVSLYHNVRRMNIRMCKNALASLKRPNEIA